MVEHTPHVKVTTAGADGEQRALDLAENKSAVVKKCAIANRSGTAAVITLLDGAAGTELHQWIVPPQYEQVWEESDLSKDRIFVTGVYVRSDQVPVTVDPTIDET